MPDDIYNDVVKTTLRPENCFALKETRVNAGVWAVLEASNTDRRFKNAGVYRMQVCKAGINLAKLIDKGGLLLDDEMKEWGSTALALLGKANIWINIRRRDLHKKDMHPSLHHLCSANTPFTDQLYGDSIIKDIKDIQEINKISKNVGPGPQQLQRPGWSIHTSVQSGVIPQEGTGGVVNSTPLRKGRVTPTVHRNLTTRKISKQVGFQCLKKIGES